MKIESSQVNQKSHETSVVPFTIPVCFLLITTRWGSHLNILGIYITDILFIGSLIRLMLRKSIYFSNKPKLPFYVLLFSLIVVSIQLFSNVTFGRLALRDGVPFLYFVITILLANRKYQDKQFRTTSHVVYWSLCLHSIWTLISSYVSVSSRLPIIPGSPNVHFLEIRGDIDPMLCGVLLATIAGNWLRKSYKLKYSSIFALVALACLYPNNSRAAFLATVIMLILSFISGSSLVSRKSLMLLIAPLFFVLVLPNISNFVVFEKLAPIFSGSESQQTNPNSAMGLGTFKARIDTWNAVIEYSVENTHRLIFGVGFGEDYLRISGAGQYLLRDFADSMFAPRSPHNYWINLQARLGIIGFIAWTAFYLSLIRIIWLVRRLNKIDLTIDLGTNLFVGFIITASLGVALESPFGALPMAWCCGVLMSIERIINEY